MHAARIAFTGLACLSVTLPASADQITLKNGDSLTGEVIAKRGNTLIFNTPYAGELKISWDEVATLKTTDAVAVMDNDERYEQRVLTAAATPTALQDAPAAVTPLAEILYINPGPEESGQGYRLTGKANFAYTQSDGNSNSDQLHADGEITLRARDYRLVVGGELDRASIEQRKADDTRRIYGSYDRPVAARPLSRYQPADCRRWWLRLPALRYRDHTTVTQGWYRCSQRGSLHCRY